VILPLSFVRTGTSQTGIGRPLYVSGGAARQPDVAWGYRHDPQGISTGRKRNRQDNATLYIKGGRTFDKTSLRRSETEGGHTYFERLDIGLQLARERRFPVFRRSSSFFAVSFFAVSRSVPATTLRVAPA
jgi:hypothetical protein